MNADDRATALALTPVSRETLARLDAYVDLLRRWQDRTNLIATSTLPHVWTRHVADSIQLLALRPDARVWLDVGSGGGFPGVVLACALADTSDAVVHLVERNAKKAAFLREALRVTNGAGQVHLADIADCAAVLPPVIDVVTARAVAPLSELLDMTGRWLDRGAVALFPKGLEVDSELQFISTYGRWTVREHASRTGDGKIVEVASIGVSNERRCDP